MANSAFTDYVAALEQVFDASIANGNDDQLFAGAIDSIEPWVDCQLS